MIQTILIQSINNLLSNFSSRELEVIDFITPDLFPIITLITIIIIIGLIILFMDSKNNLPLKSIDKIMKPDEDNDHEQPVDIKGTRLANGEIFVRSGNRRDNALVIRWLALGNNGSVCNYHDPNSFTGGLRVAGISYKDVPYKVSGLHWLPINPNSRPDFLQTFNNRGIRTYGLPVVLSSDGTSVGVRVRYS